MEYEENEVDKYEFKLSLNEINTLIGERRFEEAAQIADGIDWNHVKSPETLCRISEVYKAIGEYHKSRDIMAIAHERDGESPAITYALCELTIFLYGKDGLQEDLTRSLQLMQEFKSANPSNPKRLVLQYKMYGVSPVSVQEKIAVLEQLRSEKFFPRWAWELAGLYQETGNGERAAAVCHEIVQNAPEGSYAARAQEMLKTLPSAAKEETPGVPAAAEGKAAEAAGGVRETAAAGLPAAGGEPAEELQEVPEMSEPSKMHGAGAAGAAAETPLQAQDTAFAAGAAPGEERPGTGEHDGIYSRTAAESTGGYRELPPERAEGFSGTGEQSEQELPAEDPLSISEVMQEWEKIRSDIRRANDEKRAQRILEDTGTLWRDFDETARHGLLEDIEKGVARQRRQVRSGMYRMNRAESGRGMEETEAPRRPVRRVPEESGDVRQQAGGRRPEEAEAPRRPVRRVPEESGDALRQAEGRRPEEAEAPHRPVRRVPAGNRDALQQAGERRPEEAEAPRRPVRRVPAEENAHPSAGSAIPVSNEEDDVKVYGHHSDVDELATRRWNSEEIHRAMLRQEQEAIAEQVANADEKRRMKEAYPEDGVPAAPEEAAEELSPEETAEEYSSEESAEVVCETGMNPAETEAGYAEEPAAGVPEDESSEEYAEDVEAVRMPAQESASAAEYAEELPQEEEATEELSEEPETEEEPAQEAVSGKEELPQEEPAAYAEPAPERRSADRPERRTAAARRPAGRHREEQRTGEDSRRRRTEPGTAAPEKVAGEAAGGRRTEPGRAARPAEAAPAGRAAGKGRELTKEERRLFGPFCRMRENVEQLMDALEQVSLASSTGNVMVIGNDATAERVAKGILEVTRRTDSNFTGKIARVNGSALNKLSAEGFAKTFDKLSNGALIVGKAAELAPKAVERLYRELEGKDRGVILIMTDGSKKMEQFRHENEQYLGSFTAVINIRPLNDKALVAYAKDYAISQDYSIDEFGQLALAQRISIMQTSTHQVTLKEVRDLVDEAIDSASRVSPLKRLFSKNRFDEEDRIILHEKDFAQS